MFTAGSLAATTPVDGTKPPEQALVGLQPILTAAAQQSPRMLARALDLEVAENYRIQTRAGMLPNVGGNFRMVETRDKRADLSGTIQVQKSYYDFSITQPIFHWGERLNNKRAGEIQKAIAEGNYREAYRGLAQEVRSKYLQLIIQKLQLRRARAGLEFATQQVKLGEKRLAKSEISELEMGPMRSAEEQAQLALERSDFDYAQAKISFARLTGTAELTDDQVPDEIPVIRYDAAVFDHLLATYLSLKELPTTEAENARRQVQLAELNYKNDKTRLRPKVSLTAGMNQDEQSFTLNNAQRYRVDSMYAGVTVSWTIFDSLASQAATRSSLARLRQNRIESDEVAKRLAQQAQQQAKNLYFASRGMTISDRGVEGADALVQTKQADYKRGVATETEMGLAAIAAIDARINAYFARTDYYWRVGEFLGLIAGDPVLSQLPKQ